MSKYFELIKRVALNKVMHYVLSRYTTYFIQFINSLFIAAYLGPYYLGIWGFITLIVQYLNQINLGISHSTNTIISIYKNKDWYVQKIIGTSITMLLGLSLVVVLFFCSNELFEFGLGHKYDFSSYAPVVAIIGVIGYFNTLFSHIFRVYGRIIEIAINQSIFPILMLFTIFLFKGKVLLWALVAANLLAFVISLGIYLFNMPIKIKVIFNLRLAKKIQIKGWHLFIYNTSYYLIILSTKSFISAYYTVTEFGYFTFAFSLANVVLLLLQSFSFLIYPKLINRLALATNEKVVELLTMIRDVYITSSHLLAYLAILAFPFFLTFFPQYNQSANAFKLTALTIVLYSNSFGYSGLLVAKNQEKKLGYFSLFALLINIFITFSLTKVLHISFSFVIVATMITYFIYVFLLSRTGRKWLSLDSNLLAVLKDIYPFRLSIPYLLSVVLIIFTDKGVYLTLPLILFVAMNHKILLKLKQVVGKILTRPELINI